MKKLLALTACGAFSMLSAGPNYQNAQTYQTDGNPSFQNAQSGYNYGNQQSYQGQQPNYQGQQYYQNQQPNYPGQQQNNQNQQPNNPNQPGNKGQQPGYGYNDKSFYQISHRSDADQNRDSDKRGSDRPDDQRVRDQGKIAQSENGVKTAVSSPADEDLSKNVHDVLYGWLSSGNQNIAFEVNNGKVILTGVVNSREEKEKIEKEVKKINGVKSVDNKITILEPKKVAYYNPQRTNNTTAQVTSGDQKTKDYGALDSDKKLNAQIRDKLDKQLFDTVVIITANGVVTLAGSVENQKDFENTVKDIEQMEGVKKVNNKVSEKRQQ